LASRAENLGDGLMLRTVRDEDDVERCIAFHTANISASEGAITERLLRFHPEMTWEDFQIVEDTASHEIASTTCLIPWSCRFENVTLRVAMLEMVVTGLSYRKRGLIRRQVERYHGMVAERGYDMSIIQGIPFYYRQFGYAYAVDHFVSDLLPSSRIPDEPGGVRPSFSLRPAALDDVRELSRLYEQANSMLQVTDLRSPEFWQYLLRHAPYPLHMLLGTRDCRPVGYLGLTKMSAKPGLRVNESGVCDYDSGIAALRLLKSQAEGGDIQMAWPRNNLLLRIARGLGTIEGLPYQWLLRITDAAGLLRKLGPVFERRLERSAMAGWSGDLRLNFYREALRLRFEEGSLLAVDPIGFVDTSMGAPDPGDLRIPPDAFLRLFLGYRDLDQLRDAWPDTAFRSELRPLLEVLFPRLEAFFYMRY